MIDQQATVTTEEIDGITYTSTKFKASQALGFMSRVVQLLGEHGLQVALGLSSSKLAGTLPQLVAGTSPAQLYAAVVQLAYGMAQDPTLPKALCEKLKASELRPTGVGGSVGPAFDTHFCGEFPHLVRVLVFVLMHNFGGFTLGSLFPGGSPTNDSTSTDEPSSSKTPSEE